MQAVFKIFSIAKAFFICIAIAMQMKNNAGKWEKINSAIRI
jgi:hypothetical protein